MTRVLSLPWISAVEVYRRAYRDVDGDRHGAKAPPRSKRVGESKRRGRQRPTPQKRRGEARRGAEEERLRSPRTIAGLHTLTGRQFEDVIDNLFAEQECQTARTPISGDGGIDLILHVEGVKLVVQRKRWKSDIGEPVLRDFLGALMHANAAHGFVITTSRFTSSAIKFASRKPLTLINGELLLRWLAGSYQPKVKGYARTHSGPLQGRPEYDPHVVLSLKRGASREEIKAAYRDLIAQYHPDKVAQLGLELQELAEPPDRQRAQAIEGVAGGKRHPVVGGDRAGPPL